MRLGALALLAFASLALAACGGGSKKSSGSNLTPVAYVQSSAKKTAKQPSEHMALNATVTVQGQVVTLNGAGDFDNGSRLGTLKLDFNLAGITGTIDEVVRGTTVWMRSPLFADALPKGKTWLRIDLRKGLAARGIDLSTLGSQDPTQTLAQLQRLGDVTKIGSEQVDGVDTTHYRGRIDLSKVPQGAKIKALTNAKYGPYDVWIGDDDSLVRRMKLELTTAVPGGTKQAIGMRIDFSDFGKEVKASLPTADETYDATNATIKGLGG